ncbi:class A beta-lactamase [Pseudomonas qingdaonensis]|uniref:Beta-lactamase n=1 Tax=Pseudomonas qingdaonensis TaxID=2056231 RepID=A0ABX8DSR8_9PSED|nr:class A beta-lactamase [Pseudomonas qingdaonensis]MEC6744512.1 class A beta-lactamase [Pseudomonas qingdaonensis]QVL19277.1 class A beta-lactamase [Pseudomonas qingdaonensis]
MKIRKRDSRSCLILAIFDGVTVKFMLDRRRLIQGVLLSSAALAIPALAADTVQLQLHRLEQVSGCTLGLCAIDTETGNEISYRGDERFAFCSTFKVLLVGAILNLSQADAGLLARHITYSADRLVVYSPVTEKHVDVGMSVSELCAATLQYSDNTAGNLLLDLVGGPLGLTTFARNISDPIFRLDRNEPELNSALPGDIRDTTTPIAMVTTLQRLLLSEILPLSARQQLQNWLMGNTTGNTRIRAGVPLDWVVGDKTGSGDYGVANDVGIIWPPRKSPWILAVFTRGSAKDSPWRSETIATATRIVVDAWKF